MIGFSYCDGVLHADQVAVPAIAASVGTPFYCYSATALRQNYQAFALAFATAFKTNDRGATAPVGICYALKANSNLAVVKTLGMQGAGADVVSGGEMQRALAAGIPAGRIVFSGVGKTRDEIAAALSAGIHQINVESIPELQAVNAVAVAQGVTAPIALRVNPDVDAQTHHKIATGKKENKFGIDIDLAAAIYAEAATLPGIDPVGVAVHIGSQLTSLQPFQTAFERVAALVRTLRANGIAIARLDLGGGLGICYRDEEPPSVDAYATMVAAVTGELGCQVTIEPGRALVGNAGVLVAAVIYVKHGLSRRFVIVDAAMNDLIRPALYDAYHRVIPVRQAAEATDTTPADVVGPVCESGDTFAVQRPLPPLESEDLVAFMSAGAYGAVMASTYNTRPLVPEVLVDGTDFAIVRRRPAIAELLAAESLPPWLDHN
ncbi:MAG: diaminopimelate decarboxylase [Azospirillaceae bacterium]|nr:diaminopimelate decarboxylase [Azospirillaceae bacterium]